MKKTDIKPVNEVYSMSTTNGILAGSDKLDNQIGGDSGVEGGEDYGRENNPSRPNLWEQGW